MNRWHIILVWGLFLVSRAYVLANPPYTQVTVNGQTESKGYSDVKHDSERYANMWYYGLTPYREHLFEYPPAAIPLMLTPLLFDLAGWGNYYPNYRVQVFILELVLFAGVVYTVTKLPVAMAQKWLALLFYIGAGALAKDFWYDGLDLVFAGSLTLAIIWRLWHDYGQTRHRVIFWVLYWLSVAVKLLTVPLVVPFGWLTRFQWKKEAAAIAVGGLIVWLIPLVMFRSSLSVFLFFHGVRPLKYEALGTWVVLAINDFTSTETQTKIPPHFPLTGPVTSAVEGTIKYGFPLSILAVMGWSLYLTRNIRPDKPEDRIKVYHYLIKITLVYFFTIFLTSKIFSRPFHLWYVPLIAIYPFKNWKIQVTYIIGAVVMLALDTTPWLQVPQLYLGPVPVQRLRDLWRFIPMVVLLLASIRLPEPVFSFKAAPGKMDR